MYINPGPIYISALWSHGEDVPAERFLPTGTQVGFIIMHMSRSHPSTLTTVLYTVLTSQIAVLRFIPRVDSNGSVIQINGITTGIHGLKRRPLRRKSLDGTVGLYIAHSHDDASSRSRTLLAVSPERIHPGELGTARRTFVHCEP